MNKLGAPQKRLVALVLAVALGGTLLGFAVGPGLGEGSLSEPSGPDDPVAEVDGVEDGVVSLAELETAITRTALQQGLPEPPKAGDPGFELVLEQALQDQLLPIWALAEGEERGIAPTDEEIAERLAEVREQGFKDDDQFAKFVLEQGYCTEEELGVPATEDQKDRKKKDKGDKGDKKDKGDEEGAGTTETSGGTVSGPDQCEGVKREIGFQLVAEQLQASIVPEDPQVAIDAVPAEDVELAYEQNLDQYTVPETRDVRLILTDKPEDAEKAFKLLSEDDSEKNWEKVAKKYSIDPASRTTGGLLQGLTEGQSPGGPDFDAAAFAAEKNEIVMPFETSSGSYVVQVIKINEGVTQPLEKVEPDIRNQLAQAAQQKAATDFEEDFFNKWSQRTVCADGYTTSDCRNATPPDPCTAELEEAGACPPAVIPSKPVAPQLFNEEALAEAGCPPAPSPPWVLIRTVPPVAQRPNPGGTPCAPAAPSGLPGGIPIGPGGAPVPGAPPGAVPPGTVPPGAVPPGAVPPGAVPPGAVPPGAVPPAP